MGGRRCSLRVLLRRRDNVQPSPPPTEAMPTRAASPARSFAASGRRWFLARMRQISCLQSEQNAGRNGAGDVYRAPRTMCGRESRKCAATCRQAMKRSAGETFICAASAWRSAHSVPRALPSLLRPALPDPCVSVSSTCRIQACLSRATLRWYANIKLPMM